MEKPVKTEVQQLLDLMTHQKDAYYFYGNVDESIFYVSENLCIQYGFEQTQMCDFLERIQSKVYLKADQEVFEKQIVLAKQHSIDQIQMRFRICDSQDNVSWVYFCAHIQWIPQCVMFGSIMQQSDYLLVDPVTGFGMESYLSEYVKELDQEIVGIGIRFHYIREINANAGREVTNKILRSICRNLQQGLSEYLKFFRINGPMVVAILDCKYMHLVDGLIQRIRKIVEIGYVEANVHVSNPCQVVALKKTMSYSLFLENLHILSKDVFEEIEHPSSIMNDRIDHLQYQKKSQQILQIHHDVLNHMENFVIRVQPLMDVHSHTIAGAEVLLRWKYKGEFISPEVFVPILESQNLIHGVGRWVFEQAIAFCTLAKAIDPHFYVSVNVSLAQLSDSGLLDFIQDMLSVYALPSSSIVIEMTESVLDSHPKRVEQFVQGCKCLHISLALDDFGTGYSSISNLLKYNTSIVKMDRSLLLEMERSKKGKKFVLSLIHAIKSIDSKVIVEGVETLQQVQMLLESECDLIQGYYFYRPLNPRDALETLMIVNQIGFDESKHYL